jgi:fatty-acid peroxygenase
MLAGLTRHDLRHQGVRVPRGTRLLLDVVGTNRDERYWSHPGVFDPGRFLPGQTWEPDALVPQGGGNVATGHRCPGEDVTLGLIAATASYLAARRWSAGDRDVSVSSRRMPTRPTRGMRIVLEDEVPAPRFGTRTTG